MRVAVLVADISLNDEHPLQDFECPRNVAKYDKASLNSYETIFVTKENASKILGESIRDNKYDVYVNLCEDSEDGSGPGANVVQILQNKNVAYTGADSTFYSMSKLSMKMAAVRASTAIPDHVFLNSMKDFQSKIGRLKEIPGPWFVKQANGHDSIGITEESKVTHMEALEHQVRKMIDAFGPVMVEQYIQGPEYTVLVVENPEHDAAPLALTPMQCIFPDDHDFSHFALKWAWSSLKFEPVSDAKIVNELKDKSRRIFKACNASSYARLDFSGQRCSFNDGSRLLKSDHITVGRISCICITNNRGHTKWTATRAKFTFWKSIQTAAFFYEDAIYYGSADHILNVDPLGHDGFIKLIIQCALKRQKRLEQKYDIGYNPRKGFFIRAAKNLETNDLIYDEEPCYQPLVSRKYVDENFSRDPIMMKCFYEYCYQYGPGLYGAWETDPTKWKPINHSCDPNSWLEGLSLVARRPIKKNEEITIDYATYAYLDDKNAEDKNQFECHCGTKECRNVIRPNADYKMQKIVDKYRGHFSPFLEDLIEKRERKLTNGHSVL